MPEEPTKKCGKFIDDQLQCTPLQVYNTLTVQAKHATKRIAHRLIVQAKAKQATVIVDATAAT